MPRRPLPSRLLLASPVAFALGLAACAQDGPPPEPPLSAEALEAVAPEPGVSREALARAVDDLFAADGIGQTRALVVMHEGEIVAERYAESFTADTRFIGWSLSKAVTAVLVGTLVADGRLALDATAPIPSWQRSGDPHGEITLRYLLQMRSGLRHEEQADPVFESAEVRMMYLDGRDDMAAWAQVQPLEHDPGSTFDYSTPTSVILADIATDTIAPDAAPQERQQAMARYLHSRIAEPIGVSSLIGEYDAAGTLMGGSSIWATARDWGRFGEFLRNGGSVAGAQVVPRGWVDFMRQSSPASPDFGGQIWLNRDSGVEREVLFPEQGPDSAFALVGHLGQYVIVSPEQRLTVVRIGKTSEPERDALRDELAEIFALYPVR
ncbi:serine hydrolase domain-containing protein [Aurantiacibacter aquimixticola]|uniref:Class C beta-lactamase-related serine hydrolase n=1 Tax=Aurantiacibacter aquimixticola TaxID=1958945 RepID=A0A419RV03_9SPHN|nr:serine hydrolase [Aurantiacibacter aquimixticola]RJY09616.1 class C beta-lactamase-related serine hydrolase [Aurantiacibacter aquimixticola]